MRSTESGPEQPVVVPCASEMIGPLTEMAKEDNQSVPPRETIEPATPLAAALVDEPVSNKRVQQRLTLDEPTCREGVEEGIIQEGLACEEQVLIANLPLLEEEILALKEQGSEKQLQFAELVPSKKVMLIPPAKEVIATTTQFEGLALSEGPVSETPLQRQVVPEPHEEH